jgi:hypothetical protein
MINSLKRLKFVVPLILTASFASAADEGDFLKDLDGDWNGQGTVKVRVNSSPIDVSCNFSSNATGKSLSLEGNCTGLVIFSRAITADLVTNGGRYTGSYVGAGTGTANLAGSRAGNSINLAIRWAKEVNGDRKAQMKIEKVGADGMRLTTVDTNPDTGKSVVTSQINLRRS